MMELVESYFLYYTYIVFMEWVVMLDRKKGNIHLKNFEAWTYILFDETSNTQGRIMISIEGWMYKRDISKFNWTDELSRILSLQIIKKKTNILLVITNITSIIKERETMRERERGFGKKMLNLWFEFTSHLK